MLSCLISICFSLGNESSDSIRAESPFWESSPDEYYLNLQRHFFSVALGVRCIPALSCQNYADVLRICRDNYIKNREESISKRFYRLIRSLRSCSDREAQSIMQFVKKEFNHSSSTSHLPNTLRVITQRVHKPCREKKIGHYVVQTFPWPHS